MGHMDEELRHAKRALLALQMMFWFMVAMSFVFAGMLFYLKHPWAGACFCLVGARSIYKVLRS